MAILGIISDPEITKEHYEALRREVDWEHRHADGMLIHTAAFDKAGGLRVVDVWSSQEAMDKFFDLRLLPAMRKLKIPMPAKRDAYPLHAAYLGAGSEQYQAKQVSRQR